MLFFRKTYWQFLFKSSNEHGVHSPFVYSLITECFYQKRKNIASYKKLKPGFPSFFGVKQINIVNDLFLFLNVKKIFFLTEENHSVKQLPSVHTSEVKDLNKAQVIYIDSRNLEEKKIDRIFKSLKNDDFLVIEEGYAFDRNNFLEKLNDKVIVETYYFTLIFKRKQQAEEFFYIRI